MKAVVRIGGAASALYLGVLLFAPGCSAMESEHVGTSEDPVEECGCSIACGDKGVSAISCPVEKQCFCTCFTPGGFPQCSCS